MSLWSIASLASIAKVARDQIEHSIDDVAKLGEDLIDRVGGTVGSAESEEVGDGVVEAGPPEDDGAAVAPSASFDVPAQSEGITVRPPASPLPLNSTEVRHGCLNFVGPGTVCECVRVCRR